MKTEKEMLFEKREDHLKEKEKSREVISDYRETTRFIREKNKWKKQAIKWGHKHPKRGVNI